MQPFFERDALNGCVVRMAYGPGVRDHAGNTHPGYLVMEVRRAGGREGSRTDRQGRGKGRNVVNVVAWKLARRSGVWAWGLGEI